MDQQVTIPVKKPDGTIVKLSMADFMAYKKSGVIPDTASAVASSASFQPAAPPMGTDATTSDVQTEKVETDMTQALAPEGEMELAVSVPNTEIFEDMAAAKAAEDLVSNAMPAAPEVGFPMPDVHEEMLAETEDETQVMSEMSKAPMADPQSTTNMPEAQTTDESLVDTNMADSLNAQAMAQPMPTTKSMEASDATFSSSIDSEDMSQEPMSEESASDMPSSTVLSSTFAPAALSTSVQTMVGEPPLHEENVKPEDLLDPSTDKRLPSAHDAHIDAILLRSNLTINPEVEERLRLLIQSRVKEVRDDDAVMASAIKPIAEGGLGMADTDAMNLLVAIRTEMNLKPFHFSGMSAPNSAMSTKSLPAIDQKKRAYLPTATPLTGVKPILQDVVPGNPTAPTVMSTHAMETNMVTSSLPVYQTMGPIDEIAHFSVDDLHRLGNDKERVLNIMIQKFIVLKEESYVMFLDALTVWKQSPLYKQYQEVLIKSLNNKQTINQVLQGENMPLSVQDVDIIVQINKLSD